MNRTDLQRRLDDIGVPRNFYCLKGFDVPYGFIQGYVLDGKLNQWTSYSIDERGIKNNIEIFENEDDSCEYFYSMVIACWNISKKYWHYEQFVQDLLNVFHNRRFYYRWVNRFIYKWKLYPVYSNLDELITFINRKFPNAIITEDGNNKIEININAHTIIIHQQNGKWYVVNMLFVNIYGLVFLGCVEDVCVVVCYFLYYKDYYMRMYNKLL